MAKLRQINLLTSTLFEHSTTGRVVAWASGVGRWIVVLTEFVVITAFLSRFYFDTKLANLFDDVRQKKAIVNSSYVFEEQYRQAQNKLKLAKLILSKENSSVLLLGQIADQLPSDTTLTILSIDTGTLNIEGYTLTANGLNLFVNGLVQSGIVDEVNVTKLIERSEGFSGINFSITAKIIKKTT